MHPKWNLLELKPYQSGIFNIPRLLLQEHWYSFANLVPVYSSRISSFIWLTFQTKNNSKTKITTAIIIRYSTAFVICMAVKIHIYRTMYRTDGEKQKPFNIILRGG